MTDHSMVSSQVTELLVMCELLESLADHHNSSIATQRWQRVHILFKKVFPVHGFGDTASQPPHIHTSGHLFFTVERLRLV